MNIRIQLVMFLFMVNYSIFIYFGQVLLRKEKGEITI